MTTNDPISDMLTRIRNAMMVNKQELIIPFSRIKAGMLDILQKEGYITKVEKVTGKDIASEGNPDFAYLKVKLKYKNGKSAIKSLKRISKPSCRVYTGKDDLPIVLNKLGLAILSTSQGLMTNHQARAKGIGGEIICEIY